MHVTSKGQVTIPRAVRDKMGIIPSKTDIEFIHDSKKDRWYISKEKTNKNSTSRFKTAHKIATITMTTDEIMALTRT